MDRKSATGILWLTFLPISCPTWRLATALDDHCVGAQCHSLSWVSFTCYCEFLIIDNHSYWVLSLSCLRLASAWGKPKLFWQSKGVNLVIQALTSFCLSSPFGNARSYCNGMVEKEEDPACRLALPYMHQSWRFLILLLPPTLLPHKNMHFWFLLDRNREIHPGLTLLHSSNWQGLCSMWLICFSPPGSLLSLLAVLI
jgi:hypothetical protein